MLKIAFRIANGLTLEQMPMVGGLMLEEMSTEIGLICVAIVIAFSPIFAASSIVVILRVQTMSSRDL